MPSLQQQLGLVSSFADTARINHTEPYPAAGKGMHTRRWGREVLEAIVDEDVEKLGDALAHPSARINAQTTGGAPCGVPYQFGGWGFFNERSAAFAVCLLGGAEAGDTALHLALRNDRPRCALRLLELGIDWGIRNDAGQSVAHLAFGLLEDLHKAQRVRDAIGLYELGRAQRAMLDNAQCYERIYDALKEELQRIEQAKIDAVRDTMVGLFRKYHPDQLAEVDRLMEQYAGKYEELLLKLDRKYGSRERGEDLEEE
jgi:hypothetical protein